MHQKLHYVTLAFLTKKKLKLKIQESLSRNCRVHKQQAKMDLTIFSRSKHLQSKKNLMQYKLINWERIFSRKLGSVLRNQGVENLELRE